MLRLAVVPTVAFVLLAGAAPASADLTALKASCSLDDAADDDPGNGTALPYRFCDDDVPPSGGTTPNAAGTNAIEVPAKYAGVAGLPAKAGDATAVPGADPEGNIALDVDLSLPDPGLNPMPAGGYPLVLMMHGCCAGNKTGWKAQTIDAAGEKWHYSNAWFASRGYVVVTYTARGFHSGEQNGARGSTGQTQLDSLEYELNDMQHLSGLLADDPDLDTDPGRTVKVDPGLVIATGGSYGGGFSWLALVDPTWSSPGGTSMRLAAVAPKYGWTDIVYSLVPTGRHRRDALPSTDAGDTTTPLGFPKQSIVAGLYASGKTGVPPGSSHATFPASIDQAFACLESSDPYEQNPLCGSTISTLLPDFIANRSAYYRDDFFTRIASDPAARVPVFSAGTFTDPLFTAQEHRRMAERLKSVVPGYPIQEHYGDYQHFVQSKAKEWGDVCGADRHVCRYADYPGGELDATPADLQLTGVTTRLNRFLDHYARPPGNPSQPQPDFDVTASLQVCPQNAAGQPADEPGVRFTAPTFGALAPNSLRVQASGTQTTTSDAEPNGHAARSDPVANSLSQTNSGRCPVESTGTGGATTAGPGVASYDSAPLPSDFTMIGQSRVTVTHTGSGAGGLQLNARLYDLFPDGTQVMVDRGPRRVTDAAATTAWDLHGNGWRFAAGHRIRIELAQDDAPFVKSSTQPSGLTLSGVVIELPVREGSITIAGGPSPRVALRLSRLSLTRRRFRVSRRATARVGRWSAGAAVRAVRSRRGPGRGTRIRYVLSARASTSLVFYRALPGLRRGRRCTRPTRSRIPRSRRCTRLRLAGRLTRSARPGANRVTFTGRIGRRALRPGRYVLRVSARDTAGSRSPTRSATFRIVPG